MCLISRGVDQMKHSTDQGMTLLEVVLALSIFMMGVGFILKSDAVAHKYSYKGQVRQQMTFYAAGLLEAQIEETTPTVNSVPFSNFHADITTVDQSTHLTKVQVTVYLTSSPTDPEPVSMFTYKVKK